MKRLALAVAAALAAACGGSSTSPSIVTTATLTTDTFNGVVQPGGLASHSFTVTTPGSINVTMTAAGPPPTIEMNLGIGNPDASGNCIIITSTIAIASTTTPQLSGTLTSSGAYCVAIGDRGNAAGPITYTITVSHT